MSRVSSRTNPDQSPAEPLVNTQPRHQSYGVGSRRDRDVLHQIDAVTKIACAGVVIAVRLLARILVQEVFSAMERLQII